MKVVFDIGGTRLRLAKSEDGSSLDQVEIVPTPVTFTDLLTTFSETLAKLKISGPVEQAAGGVAGTLDLDKSTWVQCYKHPQWVSEPLKSKLEDVIGTKVYLDNDAAIAGLGEAAVGAGKNHQIVAYLTISTGFNGVKIVNKKIEPKRWGYELGKHIVNLDVENSNGTLIKGDHVEELISGLGLAEKYHRQASEIKEQQVWDQVTNILAIAVHNVIAFWSPEVIILGGSLMKTINTNDVEKYLKTYTTFIPELPALLPAALGEYSGLYGGLQFLKTKS